MNRLSWQLYLASFVIGLLLVPARVIVMFFPGGNVGEILLFGGVVAALAYSFKAKPAAWAVLVFLPAFLLTLHTVVNVLGPDNIRRGIGTGHAVSLVFIPLATFVGAYYGDKVRRRELRTRETLTSRPTF